MTKFVMMTIEDYEEMRKPFVSAYDALRPADGLEIEVDLMDYIPPRTIWPERDLDFDL